MAYIVMACTAMAYIGMAYVVMAYIVMTYIALAYIAMAYIVMGFVLGSAARDGDVRVLSIVQRQHRRVSVPRLLRDQGVAANHR